jgi:glutamate synthase (NADPH/NADH) large chain
MMRVCQLDTCPVGIATQNPTLRERFSGQPEFVETFFEYIAEEVREILASLGLRTLEEAIGRTELLEVLDGEYEGLELSRLLAPRREGQERHRSGQDHGLNGAMDWTLLDSVLDAARSGRSLTIERPIRNIDRTVGTIIGSEIVRELGPSALYDDQITLESTGSAGQSLGAFLPAGITLRLSGDANDYVAKGLWVVASLSAPLRLSLRSLERTSSRAMSLATEPPPAEIFLNGVVGERLAVRNSGATFVVEGVGDHACEYMTGDGS